MTGTQREAYEKRISYNRDCHDYDAFLDSQYIGSYPNHFAAEVALNQLVIELIGYAAGWDAAAQATQEYER